MSEYIKNAIESGIRKAEEERASKRAREDHISQLLTSFEQQVTTIITPMFEDAKRLFKEKLGKDFDIQRTKVENRTEGIRISEAGELGKRTFFKVSCNSSGEASTTSWLNGVPGERDDRRVMTGGHSGALNTEFASWIERCAQHAASKKRG